MPKNLVESKLMDVLGLERNSNQPNRSQNVMQITNMDTHHKPGTMTLRQGYELRYAAPTDPDLLRIENAEFVSFDNFFDRTAGIGTELTVEVQKGEIVAPTISGSKITDYKFRAANIWIRPYWNGSFWEDKWQWLNETWITKITVAPDATYKNKLSFEAYFGNLATMTIVNVTKDSTDPHAILKTNASGSDTEFWVDTWNLDWEVDDIVVIMRNYIPIVYQLQNYNVLRKEISFHRILSRMRIGFGGKEGRIGIAVEYINSTLQIADYSFDAVDPELVGTEFVFATVNKVLCRPYTLFNEAAVVSGSNDFKIQIDTAIGNFTAGEYHFRLTGVLKGTDEILLAETTYNSPGTEKFLIKPFVRAGSLSRRLTELKTYISETGDDYYLVDTFVIQQAGNLIETQDWNLNADGFLEFTIAQASTDLHTENNAASTADFDGVGSWYGYGQDQITSVAASNFALHIESPVQTSAFIMSYPLNVFTKVPNKGKVYDIGITAQATSAGILRVSIAGEIDGSWQQQTLMLFAIGTTWTADSSLITMPTVFDDLSSCLLRLEYTLNGGGNIPAGDDFELEVLSFTENDTQFLDQADELGTDMLTELGYQPTFNIVRDWMDAVVLNGITWVAGAWIEARFDNKIFGSQISGLSANMHDVIPAQTFLDVDRYKGEVVIGIAVLSNDSLCAIKDGAAIILDPDTGQKFETALGYGGVIKNTILVIRGTIYWSSQDDIMAMSASTGYVAKEVSDRYVRDIYQSNADKTTAQVVLDRYGSYRIALVDDKTDVDIPELVLTQRGWLDQVRYHHPEVYRNGLGGRVWFMNSGNIYAFPFDEEAFVGYAEVYGNYNSGW
jgi:hypothetical protein